MVVRAGIARLPEELAAAIAVADRGGAEHGFVHCGAEVGEAVRVRLDEQDLAVRADRGDHLDVEIDLLPPPGVGRRRRRASSLVDFRETAVRRGAGRQAELAAVSGEIGCGVRIVVSVDDRDRLLVPRPS